jgi:hypothetical protein
MSDARRPEDDFKVIIGVGPKVEARLKQHGIRTYAELAKKTPSDLAAILAGHGNIRADHIAEQDWPGQAARLAPGKGSHTRPSTSQDKVTAAKQPERHTFTVEIVVDLIHRHAVSTRVVHSQEPRRNEMWQGWDADRLVGLISDCIGLHSAQRAHSVSNTENQGPTARPDIVATAAAERRWPESTRLAAQVAFTPPSGGASPGTASVELYASRAAMEKSTRLGGLTVPIDAAPVEVELPAVVPRSPGQYGLFALVRVWLGDPPDRAELDDLRVTVDERALGDNDGRAKALL